MSELGISVNPNAINEYIAKQIIESTLGERLQETVDEALNAFGKYGNDPLKSAVTSQIHKIIMEVVNTEFSEQIRTAVRAQMTDDFINSLVSGFVSSVTTKIDSRY